MRYRVTVKWLSREDYIVTADSSAEALANWSDGTLTNSVEKGPTADVYRLPEDAERADPLPIHRTEAGYPRCATCEGGGCPDCTEVGS